LKWVFTGVSVVPVVGVARATPQNDVQDEDGHSQDGTDRDGDVERCKIAVLGFLEVGIAFVGVSVVKHWHLNTFGAFAAVTEELNLHLSCCEVVRIGHNHCKVDADVNNNDVTNCSFATEEWSTASSNRNR
jgi:hypothetical protein